MKVHADNLTVSLRQFENLRAHSVWLIIEATKAISDVDPGQVTTTGPQIGGIFVDAVEGRTIDL